MGRKKKKHNQPSSPPALLSLNNCFLFDVDEISGLIWHQITPWHTLIWMDLGGFEALSLDLSVYILEYKLLEVYYWFNVTLRARAPVCPGVHLISNYNTLDAPCFLINLLQCLDAL